MKKLLVLLFTISGAFAASSQNYLTVGQVYNFNVGDIFETECGTSPAQNPPTLNLTIVLGKWYSMHSDTVFYRDSVVSYTPPACPPPCVGSFSIGIDTVFYTHLNSRAVQDTEPNECPAVWDSVYTACGGQKEWEQGPSKSCLDTLPITFDAYNTTYSWLIQGSGGPYTNIQFEGDEFTCYCSLIYSKKNDTVCGSEWVIAGINPINPILTNFKIHPNPSCGIFTITSNSLNSNSGMQTIEVFNVLGEKVSSNPFTIYNSPFTIDLSNQPNGIYLYRVISESGELIGEGKLIIQK